MSIKSIVAKNDFIILLKLVKNKIVTISQQGLMEGIKQIVNQVQFNVRLIFLTFEYHTNLRLMAFHQINAMGNVIIYLYSVQ